MSHRQKIIVFISTLIFTLLVALAGAVPYGYFLLALGGGFVETLCWALYGIVAALLWLFIWRMAVWAVRRWPGRRE